VVVRNQELHPEVMAESDHGNADAILAVLIKVDGLESLELDDGQPSNIDP
jgi:hypothetical protein